MSDQTAEEGMTVFFEVTPGFYLAMNCHYYSNLTRERHFVHFRISTRSNLLCNNFTNNRKLKKHGSHETT